MCQRHTSEFARRIVEHLAGCRKAPEGITVECGGVRLVRLEKGEQGLSYIVRKLGAEYLPTLRPTPNLRAEVQSFRCLKPAILLQF